MTSHTPSEPGEGWGREAPGSRASCGARGAQGVGRAAPERWCAEREAVRVAAAAVVAEHRAGRVAVARSAADDDDEVPVGPGWVEARRLRQLRATVRDYVEHRRDEGASMARLVPELTVLVRQVEPDAPPDAADHLLGRVVRWSIEAFYDEPALASVPRFY